MEHQEKNQTQVLTGDGLSALFDDAPQEPKLETVVEQPKLPLDVLFTEEPTTTPLQTQTTPTQSKVEEPKQSVYLDKAKEWISEGFWEDVDIEVEVDGEVTLVPLQDLTEITPEIFETLKEQQKELRSKKIKDKYIEVDGLDDTTKRMIELKKAGGDISELIQTEVQYVHPLQNLDLENEQVQEYLVREKLKSQGLKPQYIEAEIAEMKENVSLDLEANKIIEEVNTNFARVVEQKQKEHLEKVEQIKEEQKNFKKSMVSTFRDLGLQKESLVKTLTDRVASFDENGLTEIDKAFFEAKKNPQLFAKVAYMLTDEEGFNELVGVKIKNDVKKETVRNILKITPRTSTTSAVEPLKKDKGLDSLFDK